MFLAIIVQMPSGITIATITVGLAGARLYAVRTLATTDTALEEKLMVFKQEMAAGVVEKSWRLQQRWLVAGFS